VVRSVPLVLGALVGHKEPKHVAENCWLTEKEPLFPEEFTEAVAALQPGSRAAGRAA